MLGTAVNCGAILIGGGLGILGKKYLKDTARMMQLLGICVMFLAASGFMADAIVIENGRIIAGDILPVLLCLLVGTGVGQAFRLDKRLSAGQNQEKGALLAGFLLFGVGGLQLIGPIQSFAAGDNSLLFSKSMIDFVMAVIFGAAMGKGIAFSAVPVGLMQVMIGAVAVLCGQFLDEALLCQLRQIGYIILFFVGFNQLFEGVIKVRTADMLPSVAVIVLLHGIGGII